VTSGLIPWQVAGTYVESCNCDAICPCRMTDGVPGARSTHGICMGVLSWSIVEGHAGDVGLDGLAAALAISYDDDEPGSPWRVVLYVDERGDEPQRQALEDVFLGRLGGSALRHFPWAWKPSRLLAVRASRIELDHTPRRQWLRVRDSVTLTISGAFKTAKTVTCVIPGHEQRGEELYAEVLRVDDDALQFEFHGNCGYGSVFDYSSDP
jgi:hypothetical protein